LDKEIDCVFHLAAETFLPDSWKDAASFYRTNVLGTQNALEFCNQVNAKLIYMSAYVYGIPQYLPIDEKHPVLPNNPYAHSKWLGEELCRFYARQNLSKIVILRPFNIYGPGQNERFLIPFLFKQLKEKGSIEVKDDTPRRDYLYISDFIEACVEIIDYEGEYSIFNVGYGVSFSVREVIEMIIEVLGKRIKWSSLQEKRPHEIPDTVANNQLLKKSLKWEPKVAFREGIKRILNNDEEGIFSLS
jgi:nucleoside-diphosphate-sugar epimerase